MQRHAYESEITTARLRLKSRYGDIELPANSPRGFGWWPRSTSRRPSLTQNPDRTWTFCERWCRTCGRAGAEFLTEHTRRTAYV